jgi:hypothetical protein
MKKKLRTDPILMAKRVFDQIVSRDKAPKNPAAVALGKLGGKVGGPARAASLSPARRSEIARKAAERRWSVKKPS